MSLVDTGIDQKTVEELNKPIPCEIKKCLTHHVQPATWFFTHGGAASLCTKLICAADKRNADRVCRDAVAEGHGEVICPECNSTIKTTEVIMRPI